MKNWHSRASAESILPYNKDINARQAMLHPIYTTSFEDREMFAYNSRRKREREELNRVLSQPETRIKYAFEFLNDFGDDEETRKKCYDKIAEWSDKLDTSEAHY